MSLYRLGDPVQAIWAERVHTRLKGLYQDSSCLVARDREGRCGVLPDTPEVVVAAPQVCSFHPQVCLGRHCVAELAHALLEAQALQAQPLVLSNSQRD